jgi:hypothetical protein
MVSQTAEDYKSGTKPQLKSAGSSRAVHKAASNVEKAVDGLLRRNEALIDSAAYFVAEVSHYVLMLVIRGHPVRMSVFDGSTSGAKCRWETWKTFSNVRVARLQKLLTLPSAQKVR